MILSKETFQLLLEMGAPPEKVAAFLASLDCDMAVFQTPAPNGYQTIRQQRMTEAGLTAGSWEALRQDIIARDGSVCVYCEEPTETPNIDHDVPITRGGTFDPDNLVVACPTCNRKKRGLTGAEFKKLCTEDERRMRDRERKRRTRADSPRKSTDTRGQSMDPPPKERSPTPPKEITPPGDNPTIVVLSPAGRKVSRRCPSDYEPSEAIRQLAIAERFQPGELERELAKFRDHQFRDAHTDWNAAFRNWLRRAAENRPKNGTDPKFAAKQANLERAFRAGQSLPDKRTLF